MIYTYKDIGLFLTAKINRLFTVSFDWLRFIRFACKIGTESCVKCTITNMQKLCFPLAKNSVQKICSYVSAGD